MKSPFKVCSILLLVLAATLFAQEKTTSSITIDSMLFAASIESRTPVDVSDIFESGIGNVSCWSYASTREVPVRINYIWYQNGQKVFQWMVTLKTPKGRAWCTKSVTSGKWKVEIADESGKVLKAKEFTVK